MSDFNSNSFISLPRAQVKEMCEKTIDHIMKKRQEKDNAYIQNYMERYNNSWFHKLFRRKNITFEDARAFIEMECDGDVWAHLKYHSTYAWGDLDRAKKLWKMTLEEGVETILVNSEDYRAIS